MRCRVTDSARHESPPVAPQAIVAGRRQVRRRIEIVDVDQVRQPFLVRLRRCELSALVGGSASENARIAQDVLAGERGPRRDVVLLNAAAALVVSGRAKDLREGVAAAGEAVDAGRASRLGARVKEIASA